jgi:hypothetical protein
MVSPKNRDFNLVINAKEMEPTEAKKNKSIPVKSLGIGAEYSNALLVKENKDSVKIQLDKNKEKTEIKIFSNGTETSCDFLDIPLIKECGPVAVERIFDQDFESLNYVAEKVFRVMLAHNTRHVVARIIVSNHGSHHIEYVKN